MSNALAIASVTAVLKDLLDNCLIDQSVSSTVGGPVKVTALPPSRISVGDDEAPQLNLFLYHVSPNSGWRNAGLPSHDCTGQRLSNPPLALDLFYLLTAYGKESFEAEILLGYAMQLLHEKPVLNRDAIRLALNGSQTNPSPITTELLPLSMHSLKASDLADQIEQIKIIPYFINTEEVSKLWSAFQASYRPSVAYQVSLVLIDSSSPSRSPLPVLTIGRQNEGISSQVGLQSSYPALQELQPQMNKTRQMSANLGDLLVIKGHNLLSNPEARLVFRNDMLKIMREIDGTDFASRTADKISVSLPKDPQFPQAGDILPSQLWAAGRYDVSVIFGKDKEGKATNKLPLLLSPVIVSIDAADKRAILVTISPRVLPTQKASLFLGSQEITAEPIEEPRYNLTFDASQVPEGEYFVRVSVDGVHNRFIDFAFDPPRFQGKEVEIK
jgi:hypothetical protein